jgi:hypothetical protein
LRRRVRSLGGARFWQNEAKMINAFKARDHLQMIFQTGAPIRVGISSVQCAGHEILVSFGLCERRARGAGRVRAQVSETEMLAIAGG